MMDQSFYDTVHSNHAVLTFMAAPHSSPTIFLHQVTALQRKQTSGDLVAPAINSMEQDNHNMHNVLFHWPLW